MFNTEHKEATPLLAETPVAMSALRKRWLLAFDIAVLLVVGLLLFWGTSTQFSNLYNDMTRYQCYALVFWQGQAGLQAHGLIATSTSQCAFLLTHSSSSLVTKLSHYHLPSFLLSILNAQSTTQPFHTLPPEYPFLTLIPFSLPLFAPFAWYQGAFAVTMLLVVGLVYTLLVKYSARPAALAFLFYLVLGNWVTATARFDLLPAALTLGAVILAGKARWQWAFALLAGATLLKFYPVLLVIPFLLAQQMQHKGQRWTSWRRWSALGLFIGLGVLITGISLVLNVSNTLLPVSYFVNRPVQVESLPGTLIWVSSLLGHPTQYNMAYQSLNFVSSLERYISPLSTLLELGGLFFVCWLQWRRKVDIRVASLLTLLIIIVTGKVFSPQYLIWVAPLVALVGRASWKWLLSWGLVCALTTFMFPFHYNSLQEIQQYYLVIVIRDLLILGVACWLLYWYATRQEVEGPASSSTTSLLKKRSQPLQELASELE